ncbi:MAG: hypothetical protein JWM45_470 [Pseudonocardiales bacterium]|jgi:hypothetical protein|nr:hypothetical protein [Pseudonocardiales bacterium]
MAVMDYQTRDGLTYYGFSIDFEPGIGWRVYIIFQPFHQGHDDSLQLPYQARDIPGAAMWTGPRRSITWQTQKLLPALWAEVAQRYQRTQEQHALYVKLIEHYQRTREQRRATPVDSTESLSDFQESESNTHTVASAASVMTARAGDTTATTSANSATWNAVPADAFDRSYKAGARRRYAASALRHRRSTRSARRHR